MSSNGSSIDWEQLWSSQACRLKAASLAGLVQRFSGVPGVLGLHGGIPPAEAFPFTSLTAQVRQGPPLELCDPKLVYTAQQYNFVAQGYTPLVEYLKHFTAQQHTPQVPVDVCLTSGAVHALNLLVSCLFNAGDVLVCDEYTYTHAVECIYLPAGLKLLGVRSDAQGMDPVHLDEVMESAASNGNPRPKVVYMIPTGHNPTSITMPQSRKADLYKVCQKHNLIIIEDDAYYFLQFPQGPASPPGLNLGHSLLSMDTDGRVIRVDTFAKVLGPGYRLGWVTAAPALIKKLAMMNMASTVGPNSMAQVIIHQLLQQWGQEGFASFLQQVQALYANKAAAAHAAAHQHLSGLAEWQPAYAGMFMWFKLLGLDDVDGIMEELVAERVVVVPGSMFRVEQPAEGTRASSCPYFRVSFVSTSEQELGEAFLRIATALKRAQAKQAAPAGSAE